MKQLHFFSRMEDSVRIKLFVNDRVQNAEVHYVYLTNEPKHFDGLSSECKVYSSEVEVQELLNRLIKVHNDRLSHQLKSEESGDMKEVCVVLLALDEMPEYLRIQANNTISYITEKQRITRFIFIVSKKPEL